MKAFSLIVHGPKTDLKWRSYGQIRGKRPKIYGQNFTKCFGQKETNFEAAFAHRMFSIHSISFQKVGSFSKIISLPRSWLSRFVKSIPELPRIYTGKWTTNKKITSAALIPKPAISLPKLKILQYLFH
jgi:hypothetical protein